MSETRCPRPLLHFTPQRHWINDPNGLIWHDGEYHLFYQHNPEGDTWGHMSWGHAVSTDLLHWTELPVAIAEDEQWSIFSGSTVVDQHNTSGLGDGTSAPMLAIYTGAARQPGPQGGYRQVQCLASSTDRGRTWTKFDGNPVLDLGLDGFRDPKVFWHAATARWVMLVSIADEGWLRFFASPDLKQWTPVGEVHLDLPDCRIWECPDLIELPIEGDPSRSAWLLKFDVFQGHPGGGSGALAVMGDFDGSCFVATQPPRWIDGGKDFYAAIAFAAMPPGDSRKVWLGWMNDHRYAKYTPTSPWRGAMTLPRELTLRPDTSGELQLVQRPVAELAGLRGPAITRPGLDLPAGEVELFAPGELPPAHEFVIELEVLDGAVLPSWSLKLRADAHEATRVGVDAARREVWIDRSASAWAAPEGGWPGRRAIAWAGSSASRQRLHLVVDTCSVEAFTGDGLAVLTELVFARPGATGVRLQLDAPARLLGVTAWALADPMPVRD